ncbi:MAG TPA: DUF420 domain-containing protein [Niabella sp.]|nr:DUF420 domain-containing protein [Chitinophagaceae bacterium]HRN48068.1 DUF420 domain-containing protein [Niabella sp.]HRO83762.1 DUF420 domain-containing protein [Niabella sp.]
MLKPSWKKNDKKAKTLIYSISAVLFLMITALGRVKLNIDPGFDIRIFALANAVINSLVAILLVLALVAVKAKKYLLHKRLIITALFLSILFLLSYVAHHLLAGETKFGGDGFVRYLYYFVLMTHIPLAAVVLPFIMFSAYNGLTGDFEKHRKIAKITWPLWLYVAVTGPILYLLISPYY